MNLLKNCRITTNTAHVTTDSSRQTPLMDMSGFQGCMFMLVGTSLAGSSKLTAHVQMTSSTSATASTMIAPVTAALSSKTDFGASASHNAKIAVVDVYKPTKRYVRVSWIGSTGAAGTDKHVMIQYDPRRAATTGLWDSTSIGPTTCVVGPTTV